MVSDNFEQEVAVWSTVLSLCCINQKTILQNKMLPSLTRWDDFINHVIVLYCKLLFFKYLTV